MLITRYLVITAIALGFVWSPLVAQETETPKSGGTFDENGNFLKADDVELLDFEVDEGTAVVGEVEATELETEFETEVPFTNLGPIISNIQEWIGEQEPEQRIQEFELDDIFSELFRPYFEANRDEIFGEFGFDPPTNFETGIQWVRENPGFSGTVVGGALAGGYLFHESGLPFDETIRIPTFRIPIPLPPRGPGLPPHPGTLELIIGGTQFSDADLHIRDPSQAFPTSGVRIFREPHGPIQIDWTLHFGLEFRR